VVEVDRERFFSSRFDIVVVSNPSSLHLETLRQVLQVGMAHTVLVEKPFCLPDEAPEVRKLIAEADGTLVLPGNCLRFHPAIALLKTEIAAGGLGEALECHAHFGTYMPAWHPYEDYRTTYAARRELGGGVLLTSIHEIDLVHHLFGRGKVVGAYLRNVLLDEIDVEDTAHMLLALERCRIANVSLNFFERPADRFLKIVFANGTFFWRFSDPAVRIARWREGILEERTVGVDASVDSMYVGMWENILGQRLTAFDMASVYESLQTAAAATATGEKITWN
jgi:predicted dehydrogenase